MKLSMKSAFFAASLVFATGTAQAGIEACGDVDVEANAECEIMLEGGCTASCEPINFQASCSASLYAECSAMCDAEFSAECTGSCQGSCEAECEVDPGSFDCSASCTGSCEADCSGSCEAEAEGSDARAECEASCSATCSGACDASCSGNPPEADCSAQCNGCCEGECTAEANIDCQIGCQSDLFVDCQAELSGGCKASCERPEGALFCDGQYIDHGGKLDECVGALKALVDVDVKGYSSGSAECKGNECSAEGEAGGSASCSTFGPGLFPAGAGAFGFLPLIGMFAARRRRRK